MTAITREQAQKIIEAADEVITALAGTNEDVHPESENMLRLWDDLNDRYAPPEVVRDLARIVLERMDAKAVAWTDEQELRSVEKDGCGYLFKANPISPNADPRRVIMVYTAPPSLAVPEDIPKGLAGQIVSLLAHNIGDKLLAQKIWSACRIAMLKTDRK